MKKFLFGTALLLSLPAVANAQPCYTCQLVGQDIGKWVAGLNSGKVPYSVLPAATTSTPGAVTIGSTLAVSGYTANLFPELGSGAGVYNNITVDTYGRITAIRSFNSADITGALGFTPYNATNPSSYVNAAGAAAAAPVQSVATLTGAITEANLQAQLVGTTGTTLAAGNDSRITGACQTSGCTMTGTLAATTLSASANDALLYDNSSAQSIPNNAATTVTGWTKVSDRVNANFNASTGTFTAPATGIYQVGGQLCYASTNAAVSAAFQARVVITGGTLLAAGQVEQEVASSVITCVIIPMTDVLISSGQTIVIQAYQATGSAVSLLGSAPLNTLSINRLP